MLILRQQVFSFKTLRLLWGRWMRIYKVKKIADKIKSLRLHGKGFNKYDNKYVGLNSRLDTIQAAILIEKLKVFQMNLKKERKSQIFI